MKWCIVACLFVLVCGENGPEVEIKDGKLEGKYMKTKNGRNFSGFLAIPYAKPPLNELRFKDPVPNDPWTGVRKAVEDSPICTQRNPFIRSTIIEGEEDCLYLNVYTPQLPSNGSDPLPVMVYIHGGGFICGDGTSMLYGPGFLLDRDIVLVVPNYRLGPLGFLSTQDDVVPGNMGMKDQVLVLKWVQENIAKFGGDPNSVTGFGESAGGGSIHFHMVSPMSKGLMHRAIAQSGTSLCSWAVAIEGIPRRNTEKLAKALDCPTDSSEKMIECLQKVDAYEIIGTDNIFWEFDYQPLLPFRPMVEHNHSNAFLTEHPRQIIKEGRTNPVSWITGITSSEGALWAAGIFGNPNLLKEFNEKMDRIIEMSLFYDEKVPDVQSVINRIKDFYFQGKSKIGNDSIQDFVDLYSDSWFFAGAEEAVKLHLKHATTPVYLYYFTYRGVASYTEIFGDPHRDYGVCHADDLIYLFPIGDVLFPDKQPSDTDKRVSEILTKMWTNFARTGKPTYDNNELDPIVWKPVTSENMEYLHIQNDQNIQMKQNLLTERANFWSSLPTRQDIVADQARRDEL